MIHIQHMLFISCSHETLQTYSSGELSSTSFVHTLTLSDNMTQRLTDATIMQVIRCEPTSGYICMQTNRSDNCRLVAWVLSQMGRYWINNQKDRGKLRI